jgi:hypothetical protein
MIGPGGISTYQEAKSFTAGADNRLHNAAQKENTLTGVMGQGVRFFTASGECRAGRVADTPGEMKGFPPTAAANESSMRLSNHSNPL